ncbi:MAG: hypothetical protein DWQ18_04660 [Crenarchaeota archaeon]|nr:MAG: hypothetical protein DWQ17_08470 [Thermoproteota archaeon]RDJ34191.1 MAG: hypothetical protein DWQ18_04660 [Thermoproteota archaeon]RDJ36694.1 MAG: hypothetical protein DWQ13_05950 [Thermoproteota archaeon]
MSTDKEKKEQDGNISIKVNSTSALNPEDKALLKFGEEILVKSVETAKEFAKTMITLITGLFAAYFAILKFLGAETILDEPVQDLIIVGIPPILFIISILTFVLSLMPASGKMSLNRLEDIKKIRDDSLNFKRKSIIAGTIFFIIGLVIMLIVNITLLK